ncbi:hypothetical protein [Luteipulveratus mongoliensis]|uniref:hypothetical protein n=1 Tax=Luteipulveratus mongoliensis TaxID=571913 RepID=UPI000ADAB4B2|nr:hypothetical protein [Luteipulveratus mongoliensis]
MTALSTTFTAPPGGIMTDEVGVVTGEVELSSQLTAAGQAVATVRYAGAEEWYVVTDSAGPATEADLPEFQQKAAEKYSKSTQPVPDLS